MDTSYILALHSIALAAALSLHLGWKEVAVFMFLAVVIGCTHVIVLKLSEEQNNEGR